ncbi:villin-3 isoform X1 [Arabidopsis lyrata subsp. lyrata]|uniref:villin-3 isoform X1 n=1 Tax=Arabidopsis lyrata subsp. lyrata TaxID=81972 RepID=UPI000A29C456|nr:villin-3 isoform X1 [Arabidopsis lyrata subsp. lyrata]|eukprot:XP_020877592.1 villin-3 isoform X1 [Arabidopsis lyrata subsp. lyrata]
MTEKGLSDKTYTMESIEMEVTIMRHYKLKRLKRFTTFDLLTEEMHLIMLKFIEVGQCVDPKEKQTAFEISQVICFISFASQHKLLLLVFYLVSCLYSFVKRYIDLMVSLNALSPKVPLYEITEGNEPCFFSTYFSWDSTKATVRFSVHRYRLGY